jgi:hypothetical protein
MKKKCKKAFKNYILKENIIKIHYVGSSILLMMEKMSKGKNFKSWYAFFIMLI